MADSDRQAMIWPSWEPLVAAVLLAGLAVYLAIWGDTLLNTSLPIFTVLGTLASQHKIKYKDKDVVIEGQGDGVDAAAKLAERHLKAVVVAKRSYFAASVLLVLLAILLGLLGPADRDQQLLVAEVFLFVTALALFGYSVNLKLFGVIVIKSQAKS